MVKKWLLSRISLKLVTKLIIYFLSFLTKILLKDLFGPFWVKVLVQIGSKMATKVVFILATLLPIQFSLKVLISRSLLISQANYKMTKLIYIKYYQMFILLLKTGFFYWKLPKFHVFSCVFSVYPIWGWNVLESERMLHS